MALGGVRVSIVAGREHLEEHRPCVFVFNHQSKLDVPVLIHLLRHDFTGVAKKEVRTVPVMGQIFDMAGMVFIDRGDSAKGAPAARAGRAEAARGGASRSSWHRRAPAPRPRGWVRSRRAPSTSRCRPRSRSCRSSRATPAS